MISPNKCAFPFEGGENNGMQPFPGITYREHVAIMAMQGLLVNVGRNGLKFGDVAGEAVRQADMLIKALGVAYEQ